MEKYKKNLDFSEKEIADEVADEILTVDEKDDRSLFFLILLFLICLIFLVASLSFAIFNTYYNGGPTNVIDIGTDVVVNPDNNKKRIDRGTVLFTYNSLSNTIDMDNVLPVHDDYGKKLRGDREYFDFNVSTTYDGPASGNVVYEISLLPKDGNTLSANDVRVYLTEDGKEVSINKNMVNNFSDLPDSTHRSGAKVIYRKSVNTTVTTDYTFRMWYSFDATVTNVKKQFGCFVVIDAYYEE